MLDWPSRLVSACLGSRPRWNDESINDDWFRGHFHFAANTIQSWLSPHLDIAQSSLLDFGCGDGTTDLALALRYRARKVLGVDIVKTWGRLLQTARSEIRLSRLPDNLGFELIAPGRSISASGPFDAVVSWSAFEHVERPLLLPILRDLHSALRPGGILFIQIEPLFYSPFGSHLGRFGVSPWAHLLCDETELERTVRAYSGPLPAKEIEFNFHVRSFEEYKRFIWNEYRQLNRLTGDELVAQVQAAGFEVLRRHHCHYPDIEVPQSLLDRFRGDDLIINEIILLARRAP